MAGKDVPWPSGEVAILDAPALAAWMGRVERLALEHGRRQADMQAAICDLDASVKSLIGSPHAGVPPVSAQAPGPKAVASEDDLLGSPVRPATPSNGDVLREVSHGLSQTSTGAMSMSPEESSPLARSPTEASQEKKRAKGKSKGKGSGASLGEEGQPKRRESARDKLKNLVKPASGKGLSAKQSAALDDDTTFLQGFIESRLFESYSLVVVVANSIIIGWELQHYAVTHETPPLAGHFEVIFSVLFTTELIFRLVPFGLKAFHNSWNVFDTVVVGSMLLDQLVGTLTEGSEDGSGAALLGQMPVLRMLRVIRLVRILRIIRVVRFFRELRLMIMSIIACLKSLLWAAMVMIFMLYIFAISLTQGFVDYCSKDAQWCALEEPKLVKYFGRVDMSMLSLYEAMLGGISWGEFVDVLDPLGPMYVCIFLFYITFSILAVLNVVTGLFVDNAMQSSQNDQEALIQEDMAGIAKMGEHAKEIFSAMDTDNSGLIGLEEFYEALEDKRMKAFFNAMKLDISEVDTLFMLLDRDHKGVVSVDEFLDGFMSLKGSAMSLDLHKVMMQCDLILDSLHVMHKPELIHHLQHDDVLHEHCLQEMHHAPPARISVRKVEARIEDEVQFSTL